MSDNIPFEIQMEIMKWLPVKPLIQFRSVSKQWKSVIDSSEFIKGYGARHTQPHSHILSYRSHLWKGDANFICLVDDDNETFKVQEQEFASFVASPFLKRFNVYSVVGVCHGLLCLFAYHKSYDKLMVVIWNSSIGKSFGIVDPWSHIPTDNYRIDYGFGVSPVTKDSTLVKIKHRIGMPWHVEVFTLSSGVWNVIPSSNLPCQSVILNPKTHVVIDRFIYWGATDMSSTKCILVSFDLITKEFKATDLPNSLTKDLYGPVSLSKLRESLVVYGSIVEEVGVPCCGVWVMEHDLSFSKLFTIRARVFNIVGFSKSGETLFETEKGGGRCATLNVYDPCSQQIKNLGISGAENSFFLYSYKESLLLLDHSDLHIYSNDS